MNVGIKQIKGQDNKTKILEWASGSETRANKLEQEAKELRHQIQLVREKVAACENELEEKLLKVHLTEDQIEVAEIALERKRTRMITLQERSEKKTLKLENINLKLGLLDERNNRRSFMEDLELYNDVDDETEYCDIEKRAQFSFSDILNLSKNPKTNDTKIVRKPDQKKNTVETQQRKRQETSKMLNEMHTRANMLLQNIGIIKRRLLFTIESHLREKDD